MCRAIKDFWQKAFTLFLDIRPFVAINFPLIFFFFSFSISFVLQSSSTKIFRKILSITSNILLLRRGRNLIIHSNILNLRIYLFSKSIEFSKRLTMHDKCRKKQSKFKLFSFCISIFRINYPYRWLSMGKIPSPVCRFFNAPIRNTQFSREKKKSFLDRAKSFDFVYRFRISLKHEVSVEE